MRQLRHAHIHRCIVLLLAAAMPLCCCTLRGFAADAGESSQTMSCCVPQSCCASSDTTGEPSPEPCDACGSSCCIKVIGTLLDWTPPVDEIGTVGVDACADSVHACTTDHVITHTVHPPGDPPGPLSDSAAVLRRTSHIQV